MTGAGLPAVKDAIMMGAAIVTMADSAKSYLRRQAALAAVPVREVERVGA